MSLPFYAPAQAVATGEARHVVVYRTVKEGSAARNAGGRPAYGSIHPAAEGPLAWLLPVGALSPVCQIAPVRGALHARVRRHPRAAGVDPGDAARARRR